MYILPIRKKSGGFGKYRENIELEGLSEAVLAMVKLESVKEVLFQALLLDDVKFEDGKMYAELCSIFSIM